MNELLWLLMLVICFGGILLTYRFFGRVGLYVWTAIAVIVANIQVVKFIEVFGLVATLGNVVYATSFLVTDILSENYGRRAARRAVAFGFLSLIALVVLMNVALLFTPDVRGMSTGDRELALVSFLAGAMSFAGLMDLVIRPGYAGVYELFLLPAVRVGAIMLIPALYVLFCDETFWIRYLYLALILIGPALFGAVYSLYVENILAASIALAVAFFAGGWATALFATSRGGPVRLR